MTILSYNGLDIDIDPCDELLEPLVSAYAQGLSGVPVPLWPVGERGPLSCRLRGTYADGAKLHGLLMQAEDEQGHVQVALSTPFEKEKRYVLKLPMRLVGWQFRTDTATGASTFDITLNEAPFPVQTSGESAHASA